MPHVLCRRANHSLQSYQREQHAEVGRGDCQYHNARNAQDMTDRNHFVGAPSLIQYRLDNAIHRIFKERSDISSKWNLLTTMRRFIGEITHPTSINWPERMLWYLSLSRVDPNLIYCRSSAFLNRSFVVLSKHRTICSTSPAKGESARKSESM
jgi:hypothetical protein